MLKNNKKILFFTASLLSLSLFLGTGCSNKSSQNPPANNNSTQQKVEENKNNNSTQQKAEENKNNIPEKTNDLSNRSQKIADKVNEIKGVANARVAISEKKALVGVTIPNSTEGKLTDELKKKVEDTVKNTDKEIETVAVSADAGIYERINKVWDGIKSGKGTEEFGNEFKELFNRIIPQ